MKNYKHLASLLFNEPILCTETYAETILGVLEDRLNIEAGAFSITGSEARKDAPKLYGDGTQVIPIVGSMTHRGSNLDAMSGIQSYGAIQSLVEEAVADPKVKSILLEMDSPGGTVSGAFDLRDYILSVRGQKPIVALSKDQMSSAAYLVGSACDKVYTTQTGTVGSIGVVAMHVDKSAQNEAQGIKPTFIYAGSMKTAGNPHEPLQGEALAYLQESVNDSYEMFINAVAEARGIDAKDIRGTNARIYRGEKAVTVGLSDGVRSFDAAIEELAQTAPLVSNSKQTQGNTMSTEDMEQVAAETAALRTENETLRKYILDEGYSITATGIEKAEISYIEVAGEPVDRSTLPESVVKALEEAATEKAEAGLTAFASENFPNFSLEQGKELAKLAMSNETLLETFKTADKALGVNFEEMGNSDVDGEFASAQDKLNLMVKDYMKEHELSGSVGHAKALTAVVKTPEGKKLESQARKETK